MGCEHSFENCFCVSMGTNVSTKYDMSIDRQPDGTYLVDCKDEAWVKQLVQAGCEQQEVIPAHVTENQVTVQVPENLTAEVAKSTMWEEYNSRCINCGRCNFVCPTCTCFTMQDLFYSENGCGSRYCTRYWTTNNAMAITCVWVADDATISVRSISHFQVASTNCRVL